MIPHLLCKNLLFQYILTFVSMFCTLLHSSLAMLCYLRVFHYQNNTTSIPKCDGVLSFVFSCLVALFISGLAMVSKVDVPLTQVTNNTYVQKQHFTMQKEPLFPVMCFHLSLSPIYIYIYMYIHIFLSFFSSFFLSFSHCDFAFNVLVSDTIWLYITNYSV